jgi:hypothetical protein
MLLLGVLLIKLSAELLLLLILKLLFEFGVTLWFSRVGVVLFVTKMAVFRLIRFY